MCVFKIENGLKKIGVMSGKDKDEMYIGLEIGL
jgi:hypothetical protein